MFSLSTFRKSGGFLQLVQLIENSDPLRQKALIQMVGTQDPGWAHLLKVKALTVDKIMSWPIDVLTEIFVKVSSAHLASLYQNLSQDNRSKMLLCLSQKDMRAVQTLALNQNRDNELSQASSIALIKIIRESESKGEINFEKFDPSLVIDQRLAA